MARRARRRRVRSAWCIDDRHGDCTFSGCQCDCHDGVPPQPRPGMTPEERAAHPTWIMLQECERAAQEERRAKIEERERRAARESERQQR